jgi:hypothetical protein
MTPTYQRMSNLVQDGVGHLLFAIKRYQLAAQSNFLIFKVAAAESTNCSVKLE